jgi:hypothetical protein
MGDVVVPVAGLFPVEAHLAGEPDVTGAVAGGDAVPGELVEERGVACG